MTLAASALGITQAAIIEDLADPNGPKLVRRGLGPLLPPRCRLGVELLGVAFERSLAGDPDQRAWEECRDPFRMLLALARIGQEAPLRVVTRGIERYVDETLRLLGSADAWEHPDARLKHSYLQRTLHTSNSIKHVCLASVVARQVVDDAPAARLAHCMYMALPVAPHRFADDQLCDAELVRRMGVAVDALNGAERVWLKELSYRVLRLGQALSAAEQERAEVVLRARAAWHIFLPGG